MDLRNQQIKETYGNLATINTVAGTPTTGVLQNGAGSNVTTLTIAGTLDATTLGGTLSTAAQTNITSVGTLTGLTVSGDANFDSGTLFVDVSTDRVGIGTSSPTATLTLESDSDASIDIYATNATTQDCFIRLDAPDNGGAYIGIDDSETLLKINNTSSLSSANHLVINNSGQVGIGGTPAKRLDVSDTSEVVLRLSRNDTSISGENLGTIEFAGRDTTSTTYLPLASITAYAAGTHAAGDNPTDLIFSTTANNTETIAERVRITDGGYLRMASGTGGIQFGGDTAAANALDDYDSGTYTATLTCGTSGTITVNSTVDQLSYTKIGRLMTIVGRIAVSSVSSPVGNIRLNLPTTIADLSENAGRPGGMFPIFGTSASANDFFWFGTEGDSYIVIRKGGSTIGTDDSAETFSGDEQLFVSFSYISA